MLPPLAVRATDWPVQSTGAKGITTIIGKGLMVTVTLLVLLHPLTSVPVTVYIVVEEGLAVTVAPVVDESPEAGDHT